mmetsp:Transcript_20103/g.65759  ORF Transcript_20103/g.65759 Transcript_20103/m.65759 type:complete len:218 (+) Transcript_20103:2694-3347(+)
MSSEAHSRDSLLDRTVGVSDEISQGTRLPLSFAKDEYTLLVSQKYRCICCGEPIGSSMISKNYAPCRLLDALCCKRRCHDDTKRKIPWRVVLKNDHRPHRVSKAAANFLDDRKSEPIIRLPPNATIFELEPRMHVAKQLRRRLGGLALHAMEGRPGAINATDAILQRLPEHSIHLALKDCEFWSLDDIFQAKDGSLITLLSDTIADAASAFESAADM